MNELTLGQVLMICFALLMVGVAIVSVITAFLPSRHPEDDERFKRSRMIPQERRRGPTHW